LMKISQMVLYKGKFVEKNASIKAPSYPDA